MTVYFDASFLVSLYSTDANSAAALRAMEGDTGELWISNFTEFEFVNTLALRVFRGHDTTPQSRASVHLFERDVRNSVFRVMPITESVFLRARRLSQQTTQQMGTRASDILHVAAALELNVDEFFTFDQKQARLAEAMRLRVNAQLAS